jgi:hypothetical protein
MAGGQQQLLRVSPVSKVQWLDIDDVIRIQRESEQHGDPTDRRTYYHDFKNPPRVWLGPPSQTPTVCPPKPKRKKRFSWGKTSK